MNDRAAERGSSAPITPLVEPVPSAPMAMMASAIDGEETPPACIISTTGTTRRTASLAGVIQSREIRPALPMSAGGSSRIAVGPSRATCTASALVFVQTMVCKPAERARSTAAASAGASRGLLTWLSMTPAAPASTSVSAMTRPMELPGGSGAMACAKGRTPLWRSWIGAMSAVGTVRMTETP